MPERLLSRELWLITGSYPYSGFGESTFLEPELIVLAEDSRRFSYKIRIIPSEIIGSRSDFVLDADVFILDESCARERSAWHKKLYFLFLSLLSRRAISCFFEGLARKAPLRSVLGWEISVWRIYDSLRRSLEVCKVDSVSIYSFWFLPSAAAAGLLKKKHLVERAFCRAHGYDLYEERAFHPCRKMDLESLNSVLVVSKLGADYLKIKFPGNDKKIMNINLGVGPGNFDVSFSSDSNEIRLCSCSSIIPLKRVDLIAKGVVEFAGLYVGRRISWTHYGSGPCLDDVKNILINAPRNLSYKFPGAVAQSRIYEDYKRGMHVFINASSTEGLPVSIMEALSFSIPVVATDVGGNAEAVDNTCGYLVSSAPTGRELADAIMSILVNQQKYNNLRRGAWDKYNALFDVNNNVIQFLDAVNLSFRSGCSE